ncbi:MAG: radical SAM protein [Bacteroidota bacterium]|nr:radical SAM protein [Bacteroidota bacterium]
MLKINEIFYSIQGESTKAGLPCIFVRFTYCNLRCTYCDTEYAFYEGRDYSISDLITEIGKFNCNLVEITGGEPLMQKESSELIKILCDKGYTVMLETSGSLSVKEVDDRVKIIMDVKTPSSRMAKKNFYDNFNYLKPNDEIKFVIGSEEDYEWSKRIISENSLADRYEILFSPVFGNVKPIELAEWILHDNLNVRMQLQLHKYIWDPKKRGV